MRMSYIAYLDCHTGIDGESLLGALLDVGLSLDVLNQTIALFPLQNYAIALERVTDKGVHGTRVAIIYSLHEYETYTWSEIETLFSPVQIPAYIRNTSLAILRCIADAEAVVRGDGTDFQSYKVVLSELILIISIVIGLKELGIAQLYASILPLTSVYNQTSSSQMPMPSPVTLEILRHSQALWKPTSIEDKRVTSLGAAFLALLARFDTPTMTIEHVGYGCTTQSQPLADSLRLYLGTLQETGQQGSEVADTDWVTVLATNIDNMSGELLGGLMERLFAVGALDVSYTPMQMKKNRPATMLMVVCPLEKGNELAHILLRETTTLGVRIQQVQRLKAQRTPQQIDTPLGPMLIKVKRLGTQIISASPEYEECQRIALEHNMPLADVYAVVQQWIAKTIPENSSPE
ncbi:MAG: nickel pincer cofactor biosynthesis protein LarC [Ktedonobacteraceae bacterium]